MKSGENFAIKLDGTGILSDDQIIKEVTKNGKYSEMIRYKLATLERENFNKEFGNIA